ncbi:Aste57867_18374 [Aphanomyces stellatus]|uniref:oligopeptidase A n=1 Tax=Aphanomyces stellatus TaxID=120398 RepID=A0A485LA94_9STRA|nr:hypothetical protein As57867_018312 [Aphanomyces stellatus]VFT95110.1 Aste57867_18374 [Aphanomyces stellatus]
MQPTDIAPALRAAIDEMGVDLDAIEDDLADPEAAFTWDSVMDRLEIIDDPLDRLWRVVLHLCEVVSSPELRAAQADMQDEVLAMQSRRAQSTVIFQAMTALRHSDSWASFSSEQQRVLARAIQQATLSGVTLAENDKHRFNEIHARLTKLNTIFSNNTIDAVHAFSHVVTEKAELDGVPESHLILLAKNSGDATAEEGPWTVTLEWHVYVPIMKYCANRSLRETLFRANIAKASSGPHDNSHVIHEILCLRHEQARLLGLDSYAELSLATKMAPSVAVVNDMIESLRVKSLPVAHDEMQRLQEYATAHGQVDAIKPWDINYWTERLRKDEFDLDDDVIRPYFPLPRVLAGVFELAQRLFGVRIEAADGDEETWHPDVLFYKMRAMDEPDEPVIAEFFLDLFARPGKQGGAWIEVAASRSKVLRTAEFPVRIPAFSLLFDLTPPVDASRPTLLTFREVEMAMNVFGYGLRIGLTAAEYTSASRPTGVEWDCVDVPGQFFNVFAYDRGTIELISGHIETGEPLPEAIFDQLIASKEFMTATTLLRTLHMSAIDMTMHHHYDPSKESIFDIQARLDPLYFPVPSLAEDRSLCSMYHVFPGEYAAGYYSYLWSEVLALDAYEAFEEAQSTDEWAATGRKYRDTMMALVGIYDPNHVFEMFRGRKANPDALLKRRGLL